MRIPHLSYCILLFCLLTAPLASQEFSNTPVPLVHPTIDFRLNTPISHLDINEYASSHRATYTGTTNFRFFTRPRADIFLEVRWDLDASDGINFSAWYRSQDQPATIAHHYSTGGMKLLTFELRLTYSNGANHTRTKQYELFVAPAPTNIFGDQSGNKLFLWQSYDGVYDKPVVHVEGFDPLNDNIPALNYAVGRDLFELVRLYGYDILSLEFNNGGIAIEDNAPILLGATRFAHNLLSNREGAVQVVGVSMGGVIARYALAESEGRSENSGNHIEHYVNTFVSFDSPQIGAHINTNFQSLIQSHGNQQQQALLQSTAAKQMLFQNPYGQLNQDFYNRIRSLNNTPNGYTNGYPRRCANFSISNGNFNSNYPQHNTSTPLATLRIYPEVTVGFFDIPLPTETINLYAQTRDLWPGSTFTNDLTRLHQSGILQLPAPGSFWGLFFHVRGTYRFQVNFNPSYTPTESALDWRDFTRTQNGSITGGSSWFDGTLVQTTFRRHEELTQESKTRVLQWLDENRTRPYLGRPSGVMAATLAGEGIRLNFTDEAAFEQGFRVERRIDGGQFQQIATLQPNTITFVDPIQGLQPFQRYTYRISSYAGTSSSDWSQEVSARAHPHLASASQSATGSPGQRKVASFGNISHAVYESEGSIWYTRNTGSTWSGEQLISGSGTARNPSIAVTEFNPGVPYVHIVWDDKDPGNPQRWQAHYAMSVNSGLTWTPARMPASAAYGLEPTTPVVCGDQMAVVFWKSVNGLAHMPEPSRNFHDWRYVHNVGSDVRDFSVTSAGIAPNGLKYFVSFVLGGPGTGHVYAKQIVYSGWNLPSITYGPNRNISAEYGWVTDNARTSITSNDTRVFVLWDAISSLIREEAKPSLESSARRVFIREFDGTAWLPVREFVHGEHQGRNSSVGIDSRSGSNRVNLVWDCDEHIGKASRDLGGSNWTAVSNFGPGFSPTIVRNPRSNGRHWGIWASGSGPYSIVLMPFDDAVAEGPAKVERQTEIDFEEESSEQFTENSLRGSIIVQSAKYELVSGNSRTPIAFEENVKSWFDTKLVTAPSTADSIVGSITIILRGFRSNGGSADPGKPVVSIRLAGGRRDVSVRTITVGDLLRYEAPDTILVFAHSAGLSQLRGKSIRISQKILGVENNSPGDLSELILEAERGNAPVPENGGIASNYQDNAPVDFALEQNYPNPFNPSTTIRYDIPWDVHVTLELYNILGDRVTTLVDSRHTRGVHHHEVDGNVLASGVYFYRLTAGSFTSIRKMVLLK